VSSQIKKPSQPTTFDDDKTQFDRVKNDSRSTLDDAFEARTVVMHKAPAPEDDTDAAAESMTFSNLSFPPVPPSSLMPPPPLSPPQEDSSSYDDKELARKNYLTRQNVIIGGALAIVLLLIFVLNSKSTPPEVDQNDSAVEAAQTKKARQLDQRDEVRPPTRVEARTPQIPSGPPLTAAVLDQFDISFAKTQAQGQRQ
jgi:hypothetical protein